MARIPNDEIERLKREISVQRLVEARGIKLTKHGADLMGLCVFHEDREPSLVVSPDKNLWHCLGACQTGGSVIDWVMRAEGVSFRHAVELLRGGNSTLVASPSSSDSPPRMATTKKSRQTKLAPLAEVGVADTELFGRVVELYHATLGESPEALAYVAKRGISREAVQHFRLGYANRTLGYRLPMRQTKAGADLRGRLEAVGVFRASGHEHLAGSLVIPLFDEHGRVVQLYGRKILDDLREGTPKHLYLPGPHRGVFNRAALSSSDEVIVCEALIDALTFWSAGYRNVTSAYGIEGVTDELFAALASSGARVKIAFDRDDAGERGAEKLSARLIAEGVETYRVMFPKGMDANLYAEKVTPATDSLGLVLRQAQWMGKGAAPARPSTITSTKPRPTTPESSVLKTTPPEAPSPPSPPPAPSADEEERAAKGGDAEARAPSHSPLAAFSSGPVARASAPSAPAAAPSPPSPPQSVSPPSVGERKGEDVFYRFGDRCWRTRAAGEKAGAMSLRMNVMVRREGERGGGFYVDTLELYAAKQRAHFVHQAAIELEVDEAVLRRELGQILLEVEAERDQQASEALEPKSTTAAMTDVEREEAMALLSDPGLLDRVLGDLERAGIVGEETNKLVAYLAATSRKLEAPLAVVIQSSSAAGKSSLMDAVLSLMPDEERVQYSAMTGQSLFYMGGEDLRHKVLAIVEEEGAERASYALKLLQSEGELTIASTGKDPATGRLVTQTYRVEGPVMIFLTTTAIDVDEEMLNRCLVLAVDEGREQTRAIHERQRESQTLEGLLMREARRRIRRTHQNAQRLLKPLAVVNPYAMELRFADHTTRTRRDHMKYLTLIRAVTLLHQMQRPRKTAEHQGERIEYIEATREDIAIANRLANAVLGRSLDELPPQTRRLLDLVLSMTKTRMDKEGLTQSEVRFTRREVRECTRWGNSQLKLHLDRLEELEYVLAHRVGRGGRGVVVEYELAYSGEGQDGAPFVLGLGNDGYDPKFAGPPVQFAGPETKFAGPIPIQNGVKTGGLRGPAIARNADKVAAIATHATLGARPAHQGSTARLLSYRED